MSSNLKNQLRSMIWNSIVMIMWWCSNSIENDIFIISVNTMFATSRLPQIVIWFDICFHYFFTESLLHYFFVKLFCVNKLEFDKTYSVNLPLQSIQRLLRHALSACECLLRKPHLRQHPCLRNVSRAAPHTPHHPFSARSRANYTALAVMSFVLNST